MTLLVAILAFQAQPSLAANNTDACTGFQKAIELNDGSVVAAGLNCLVKFDPSGNPDPGFGTAGSSPLQLSPDDGSLVNDERPIDLIKLDSGFLLVTNYELLRFQTNGNFDPDFADGGRFNVATLEGISPKILAAAVATDGSIFFTESLTNPAGPGQLVAKLKPSGDFDPAFSGDGVFYNDAVPGLGFDFSEIAVDNAGYLLVGGGYTYQSDSGVAVMRLSPAGEIVSSFGVNGVARAGVTGPYTICCQHLSVINDLNVAADDTITLLGGVTGTQEEPHNLSYDIEMPFATSFNAYGFSQGGGATYVSNFNWVAHALLPDGNLAMIGAQGVGALAWAGTYAHLKPDTGYVPSDVTFNPVTGNLTAAGELTGGSGKPCLSCSESRGAVTKVEAGTAHQVLSFGTDGVAMFSPNTCDFGAATEVVGAGPWIPCRIMPPAVSGSVKFHHADSRNPSLVARLKVPLRPSVPEYAIQRIDLKLPDTLRLRRLALRRDLVVSDTSSSDGTFDSDFRNRRIRVTYTPTVPEDNAQGPAVHNGTLSATIKLRRGGLRPISKRRFKRGFRFPVKASFLPQTSESKVRWGESTSRKTFKAHG